MEDPKSVIKKKAELDQSVSLMVEMYPTIWRGLYDGLIEKGFTEPQAMDLLREYIRTTLSPAR